MQKLFKNTSDFTYSHQASKWEPVFTFEPRAHSWCCLQGRLENLTSEPSFSGPAPFFGDGSTQQEDGAPHRFCPCAVANTAIWGSLSLLTKFFRSEVSNILFMLFFCRYLAFSLNHRLKTIMPKWLIPTLSCWNRVRTLPKGSPGARKANSVRAVSAACHVFLVCHTHMQQLEWESGWGIAS